jgi:hypothetical protein
MSRHLSNWLEYYLKMTEHSEPPILYHLWAGIGAIASVLQRKCFTNWGARGYVYPNFYIALVGPPGGRKGTAMKIAKRMVQELQIPMASDAVGSSQILFKELQNAEQVYLTYDGKEKYHKSLSVWSEEFQVFLSEKNPQLMSAITDLFDCPDIWKYSSIKQGVVDVNNCFLTLIGAITPSLLQTKLSLDAVGGGLLSRIILVVGYGPAKKIAFQFMSAEEKELSIKLQKDLEQIKLMTGPFELTQGFLNIYGPWYEQFSESQEIDSEKFLGYNSRRALHLNKLCMIMSASESNDMQITSDHFKRALAILEYTEAEMPNAFYGIGHGAHAAVYARLLDMIEARNGLIEYEELIRHFQMDVLPHDMDKLLSLAERSKRISIERSATKTMIQGIDRINPQFKMTAFLNKTLFSKLNQPK